jgi:hypothetical protein
MPHREPSSRANARPTLNACIRALYEDTLVPVREIARLAGITERNVYATVRRLGCRPRMRLAPGGGRRLVPLSDAPPAMRGDAGLDAALVRRAANACRRAVERQRKLAAVALARRQSRAAARSAERKCAADLRALSQLGSAFRELARLDTAENAQAEARARAAAEEAARTEERRRELARRIANLSRDVRASEAPSADSATDQASRKTTPARIRLVSD